MPEDFFVSVVVKFILFLLLVSSIRTSRSTEGSKFCQANAPSNTGSSSSIVSCCGGAAYVSGRLCRGKTAQLVLQVRFYLVLTRIVIVCGPDTFALHVLLVF
jgi:hypothetical protein